MNDTNQHGVERFDFHNDPNAGGSVVGREEAPPKLRQSQSMEQRFYDKVRVYVNSFGQKFGLIGSFVRIWQNNTERNPYFSL